TDSDEEESGAEKSDDDQNMSELANLINAMDKKVHDQRKAGKVPDISGVSPLFSDSDGETPVAARANSSVSPPAAASPEKPKRKRPSKTQGPSKKRAAEVSEPVNAPAAAPPPTAIDPALLARTDMSMQDLEASQRQSI